MTTICGFWFVTLWGLRHCEADPSPPAGSSLQKQSSKTDGFLSLLGASLLEEALPVLSASECCDCTTDGAAEVTLDHLRVGVGWLRPSFDDGPVLDDTVKDGVVIV